MIAKHILPAAVQDEHLLVHEMHALELLRYELLEEHAVHPAALQAEQPNPHFAQVLPVK